MSRFRFNTDWGHEDQSCTLVSLHLVLGPITVFELYIGYAGEVLPVQVKLGLFGFVLQFTGWR